MTNTEPSIVAPTVAQFEAWAIIEKQTVLDGMEVTSGVGDATAYALYKDRLSSLVSADKVLREFKRTGEFKRIAVPKLADFQAWRRAEQQRVLVTMSTIGSFGKQLARIQFLAAGCDAERRFEAAINPPPSSPMTSETKAALNILHEAVAGLFPTLK